MKRTFEIEWPDENGPMWMNVSNLLAYLMDTCPNTRFTVRDLTGDCDIQTESSGIGFGWGHRLEMEANARTGQP